MCVPRNMEGWHLMMFAPTMERVNISNAGAVLVSYDATTAYWIEVIPDEGRRYFSSLRMPNV